MSSAGGPVVELDAELLRLHRHAGPAAEVGHQHAGVVADRLAVDVLVGGAAGPAQRRGVQPALVGERRRADVRVGGVRRQVHQLGHVVAHRGEPLEAALGQAAAMPILSVRSGMHGHEVGVAGALAVAVDRALHLGGAADAPRPRELATAQPVSFWVWMPSCTSSPK